MRLFKGISGVFNINSLHMLFEKSVIEAIAKTTKISDTVKEIKNGIALFIGGEEAERIFPDDNLGQIDIDEILGFWLALNYEFGCSQDNMLDEYAASEVIR